MSAAVGQTLTFGDKTGVITSVSITSQMGQYDRVEIGMMLPRGVDVRQIFAAPEVKKAIQTQAETQAQKIMNAPRTISFED